MSDVRCQMLPDAHNRTDKIIFKKNRQFAIEL